MANWRDEVLLEADLIVHEKKKTLCKVTLIPGVLFYSPSPAVKNQYEEKTVKISDIIGCHCSSLADFPLTSTLSKNSNSASFTVYAYPFRKRFFSGKKTRDRQVITFEVDSCSSLEENRSIALTWKNAISCLARGFRVKPCDVERCVPPPWGRFLVLVNPRSGPGRAMQIFKNEVEPMFEEASIPFKLVVTEYAGHANDLMQNLDLSEWAAIVIVSGDGLIHEVINGLMQRADWTSAIKKAIGCVPGGSGNALACSVINASGEPVLINPVLHSTFVLIKHQVTPMDLVLVQTPTKKCYSFLSITWGFVADADLESEKYRYLGEARFTLGAVKGIVSLRAYKGKLSFLPVAEYAPKTVSTSKALKRVRRLSLQSSSSFCSTERIDSKLTRSTSVDTGTTSTDKIHTHDKTHDSNWSEIEDGNGETCFSSMEQRNSLSDTESADKSAENGPLADNGMGKNEMENALDTSENASAAVVEITKSTDIRHGAAPSTHTTKSPRKGFSARDWDMQKSGTVSSSGTTNTPIQGESKSSRNKAKDSDCEEEITYADKKDGQAVPTPLLPPLDQPVPDDWVVIDGKFVLFCALYQTHLGSDLLTAPSARLADGVIHLMFIPEGISRSHLINVLFSLSEGRHVDMPGVEFVPVLAFRLEPGENSGHFMIDGEMFDPAPLQGQVLPSLGRIMAIQ